MPSSPENKITVQADAERRLMAIHGAATAAVSAVSRLSSILPLAGSAEETPLEEASHRLAASIRSVQQTVERLVAEQSRTAPESDKWQKRYHAVERERDSLQDMLIALKDKYEKLQRAYHELGQAHDRKRDEAESLQLKTQDAADRLDRTLFLIDVMMRDDHDDDSDEAA